MKKWLQTGRIVALAALLLLCSACGAEAPAAPEDSELPAVEQSPSEQETLPAPEPEAT